MKIAIVEDERECARILKDHITRYCEENSVARPEIAVYESGDAFLFAGVVADIVLMDINLPGTDGMTVCEKLRESNSETIIIFVTDMAKFAVKGYKVDALDFVVKPVSYEVFSVAFSRALKKTENGGRSTLRLRSKDGFVRLAARDVLYVEVLDHDLIYHTTDGTVEAYGQLKNVEDALLANGFVKCNRCFIANPAHIKAIKDNTIFIGDERLQISVRKKKETLAAIARYFGEN